MPPSTASKNTVALRISRSRLIVSSADFANCTEAPLRTPETKPAREALNLLRVHGRNAAGCQWSRMNTGRPTIFVVDDDAVRRNLARLLGSAGWDVETFPSARDFLARETYSGTGCVVLDVRMPGLTGIELQDKMSAHGISLPIVFLTGHGNVPTSVQAMKKGAVDFLLKPVDDETLLRTVREAIERHAVEKTYEYERHEIETRLSRLSSREREVMEFVIRGVSTNRSRLNWESRKKPSKRTAAGSWRKWKPTPSSSWLVCAEAQA
jgi:two-component system, LuxR family, response regulator FixJ